MSHRITNPSTALVYPWFGRCFGLDKVGTEEVVGPRRMLVRGHDGHYIKT